MRKINLINKENLTVENLKKIKRSVPVEMRNRIQAIILIMQGWQAKQVANSLGTSDQTIRRYVRNFNEGSITKLLHVEPKPGRTPKLTEEQQREILEVIKKSPADIGYGDQQTWYYKSIASYIKDRYEVSMTDEGVRLMIQKLQKENIKSKKEINSLKVFKKKRGNVSGF